MEAVVVVVVVGGGAGVRKLSCGISMFCSFAHICRGRLRLKTLHFKF